MLGMGGATKLSVCKSQGKQEEVNRFFTNTVYLAILFFRGIFLLGLFFSDQLAILLGADANVLEMTEYLFEMAAAFCTCFYF
ncbi:MAG: MATE family efflux transporter [Clostridia bacterium]